MALLNLKQLKMIHVLIQEGTAGKAAVALGVTPATISYTLKQIKVLHPEPLFKKVNGLLIPSVDALKYQEEYKNIAVTSSEKKELTIATYSVIELMLSQYIYDAQYEKGKVSTRFVNAEQHAGARLSKLRNRIVDIDIGGKLPDDSSIISKQFSTSEICMVARENHPVIQDAVTMDNWRKCGHVRWKCDAESLGAMLEGFDGEASYLSDRTVRYESNNLLSLMLICSRTDYIMLMPKAFIEPMKRFYKIKAVALPENISLKFNCNIHYHRAIKGQIESLELAKALQS